MFRYLGSDSLDRMLQTYLPMVIMAGALTVSKLDDSKSSMTSATVWVGPAVATGCAASSECAAAGGCCRATCNGGELRDRDELTDESSDIGKQTSILAVLGEVGEVGEVARRVLLLGVSATAAVASEADSEAGDRSAGRGEEGTGTSESLRRNLPDCLTEIII